MPSRSRAQVPPPAAATPEADDFRRLRESGRAAGLSKTIGGAFVAARDALARALVRAGVTPNRLTLLGFVVTCGAGYCLARGALQQVPYFYSGSGPVGWWPLLAGGFLALAGAMDMLDGAVARVGNLRTRFGAILDSSLDRFCDMAIFLGCAWCFVQIGNLTGQLLAVLALCNAVLISYVKARAEAIIEDCSVGYWLRGERIAAMLIGCVSGHVLAALWQLALLSFLTVLRRLDYARRAAAALDCSRPVPSRGPEAGLLGALQLWRHPRGSIPYDVVTGLNIAYIIGAPWLWAVLLAQGPYADPLRRWLTG
jgi:CDP-diacylglycerol--glycerol-3-phosphate 3-phosphatidyltransferase